MGSRQGKALLFYLYLFVDVWSRRIMKAVVLGKESAEHAARLLAEACAEHDVQPRILTLHSDNGGPMKGSTMLATMQTAWAWVERFVNWYNYEHRREPLQPAAACASRRGAPRGFRLRGYPVGRLSSARRHHPQGASHVAARRDGRRLTTVENKKEIGIQ